MPYSMVDRALDWVADRIGPGPAVQERLEGDLRHLSIYRELLRRGALIKDTDRLDWLFPDMSRPLLQELQGRGITTFGELQEALNGVLLNDLPRADLRNLAEWLNDYGQPLPTPLRLAIHPSL